MNTDSSGGVLRADPVGEPIIVVPDEYRDLPLRPVGDDAAPYRWQEDGLCNQTDPEIFFPEKGGSTREAKSICQRCGVRDDCLNAALENDERFGIWGGLSERERRRLRRSRGSSAA